MPPTAGLGFKPRYFEDVLARPAAGIWYEVHAENYMIEGGPQLSMLERVRDACPVSVHGVGLSLAADADPDEEHLTRLRELVQWVEPFLISEHLAWSSWSGHWFPDLLPFPRTQASLDRLARNIEITQERLRRRILIENPSHYIQLGHELPEPDFLAELTRRTGCGLLIDVNNVYVSSRNLQFDARTYLAALPAQAIEEIHLAGHAADSSEPGALLVDTHGASISEDVWGLYERLIAAIGPRPTLIERDENLPSFGELLAERNRAQDHLIANVRHSLEQCVSYG